MTAPAHIAHAQALPDQTAPSSIADRYLAVWNEADADARRTLLAATWTDDATYVDPVASAEGHAGLDALIGGVQAQFPGFRFALVGVADGHGEHVRFSWGFGPGGDPVDAPVQGTDYVRLEKGRIKAVTGFLDRVPG